jgi:hypothetical protein
VENVYVNKILNNLPTSLELEDEEIDQLIVAGRLLLRREPSFISFMERSMGRLVGDAITDRELCDFFLLEECARFEQ